MADARNRLIVGLDVPSVREAEAIVDALGDDVLWYKIGYQLVFADGFDFVRSLTAAGKSVFLDMKLLDIDNTVAKGVEGAARMGVSMLTVHAYPKAMRAAVEAARGSDLCLLGVTVLTSMDAGDCRAAGYAMSPEELVQARSIDAKDAGMGGIVASPHEAADIRKLIGPDMALVTPGIRPVGSDPGDQKRIATPAEAIAAGASHLVVARPIVQAADPKAAARAILADIESAMAPA